MSTRGSFIPRPGRRIRDARGRAVSQLDPVRLHLLREPGVIPAGTLRAMTDEILPGARRQAMLQVLAVALGFTLVIGGSVIYFRYFSTWKGFDPVNITISIVQVVVILSGPVLAYHLARSRYAMRIARVMLRHRHCPHCGYDIRGLPADPADGATVCPECGCAWHVPHVGAPGPPGVS
jgi:hypothetical protein